MQEEIERIDFMNSETLEKLSNVIQVLGNIEVKGKTNLLNLGGSIAILEEVLQGCINAKPTETPKE